MAFENQEKANKYFIDYFEKHTDDVTKWFNAYITSDITGTMFNSFPRTAVGSFYSGFDNDTHNLINPTTIDLESIVRIRNESEFVSEIFKNYCRTLSNTIVAVDPEKPYTAADNPFDYYINSDKILTAFRAAYPNYDSESGETHTLTFFEKDVLTAIVTDGTYEYTGSNQNIHLIIAVGDRAEVKVRGTFNGLIVCNGKVSVYGSGTATFSSDADSVVNAFLADNLADQPNVDGSYTVKDGDYKIKDFFNIDILEQFESSSSSAGDAWNVAELVSFKSWSRK